MSGINFRGTTSAKQAPAKALARQTPRKAHGMRNEITVSKLCRA